MNLKTRHGCIILFLVEVGIHGFMAAWDIPSTGLSVSSFLEKLSICKLIDSILLLDNMDDDLGFGIDEPEATVDSTKTGTK